MTSGLFWLLHRLTGLILIGGVSAHLLEKQYGLGGPYGTAGKTVFLLSAVYHASHGLWGLVVEHIRSEALRRLAQGSIILLGIGLVVMAV